MLRITKLHENGTKIVLKLEGKITDEWATLLDEECQAALRSRNRVELDCAAVNFLDEKGIEVLKNLSLKRVTFIGTPDYVTEMLQTGGRS
jgi:anti-anti-sigma regulatory factor